MPHNEGRTPRYRPCAPSARQMSTQDATKFLGTASRKSTVRRARTRSIGYVQTVDVAARAARDHELVGRQVLLARFRSEEQLFI